MLLHRQNQRPLNSKIELPKQTSIQKMMNFVAICLVVSSLAAAGVWSPTPSPEKQSKKEEVIVKEGHRVVVVEFDQGKPHTKVSISPSEHGIPKHAFNVEQKISSAAAADALKSAKDNVKEAAHEVAEHLKEMAHEAKDVVSETAHKVIDEKKEMAHKAKEAAKDAYGNAKEAVLEKAYETKENIKDARDFGKTIRGDIARNVSEKVENVRDSVVEKAKEAKEGAEHVAKRLGQYFYGILRYMGIPRTLNALMGLINLLGFSSAYGMCVWVTFISSYVLAGAMPRQQFGLVQSKIYPVYFKAMACCIGLALLGHMPLLLSSKAGMFQGFNLLASILMVLINSIYLEPLATKVMFERMKVEKEEGRGIGNQIGETGRVTEEQQTRTEPAGEGQAPAPESPAREEVRTKMFRLSERLKKLNTYSSILNILTLMSLSWHLVYLSQSLHTLAIDLKKS